MNRIEPTLGPIDQLPIAGRVEPLLGNIDELRITKDVARYGQPKAPEQKWKFKNWIFPFTVTWGAASWLYGGSITGSTWWTANDNETKQVESFCILGFCFEKEIGDLT